MEAKTMIRKGAKLGSGGYGCVFRAVESATNRVVALKQSRASLRLKRPILQHEARVLKLLWGHPNIPEIYAYGRIDHFEMISMQLLHRSLGDVVKEGQPLSPKTVANVACQMIDALEHVHSHLLVHRDIKPDNIMLQSPDNWKLCLIDFGLACPLPSLASSTPPAVHDFPSHSSNIPAQVLGTLPFASLNAHEKEPQLTFRDDLESLAYTLLWLLRGNLPWSYYTGCGTYIGRMRQVLAQKKRHTASTLVGDLPLEFGDLADYARSLSFDGKPDYRDWFKRFEHVESTEGGDALTQEQSASSKSTNHTECPVEIGQVVLVKLNPSVTADGYTIREGHELSFVSDPLFHSPEWSAPYRPAVVAQVEWDEQAQKHTFLAVAISRGRNSGTDSVIATQTVSITSEAAQVASNNPTVQIGPGWPLNDAYFYVFKRPVKFYCLPSQERVQGAWRVTSSDCNNLLNALGPLLDSQSESQERKDLKSSNRDIRYDVRMRSWNGYCKFYAEVQSLAPAHLSDDSIDWFSQRAWFDECAEAMRYHTLNDEFWWTGAWFPPSYHPKEGDMLDSYNESDYASWSRQSERSKSLTLATINKGIENTGDVLAGLAKIVGLEQERA